MSEAVQEFLQNSDDGARTLQYAEHTADDKDEKNDAGRFFHAAGNGAKKSDDTYGYSPILKLFTQCNAFK